MVGLDTGGKMDDFNLILGWRRWRWGDIVLIGRLIRGGWGLISLDVIDVAIRVDEGLLLLVVHVVD